MDNTEIAERTEKFPHVRVFHEPTGRWACLAWLSKKKGCDPALIWDRWNRSKRPQRINDDLFKPKGKWSMGDGALEGPAVTTVPMNTKKGEKLTRLLASKKVRCLESIREVTFYLGDDGQWYTAEDLAAITGAVRNRIYQRIRKHGLDHPKVLAKVSRTHQTSKPGKVGGAKGSVGARSGSSEYLGLADKPRDHLLDKLPSAGSWERLHSL